MQSQSLLKKIILIIFYNPFFAHTFTKNQVFLKLLFRKLILLPPQ